ncbi:pilus assembly protein MshP [Stutzerimonas nitrititolerans]|uniref:pilus assembly protein MshP n=1 Tax=Stutzerimonas nitrititolerans TaxID=2482751 RepID=UPI002899BD78|nr:pilus assembly protein MshP [Stutzerimonas nitrititolerans]
MFLIIVIAGAIAAMWRMSVTQSETGSLALQQARAYQAARAGIEYGISRALSGEACTSTFTLDSFDITVSCTASAEIDIPEEGRKAYFHTIVATAEYGSAGGAGYAFRKLEAVVEQP